MWAELDQDRSHVVKYNTVAIPDAHGTQLNYKLDGDEEFFLWGHGVVIPLQANEFPKLRERRDVLVRDLDWREAASEGVPR